MPGHGIWAGLVVAALGGAYLGCTQDFDQFDPTSGAAAGGLGSGGSTGTIGAGGSSTCTVDAACDDHNPCTLDSCDPATKQCQQENAPDGPAPGAMDAPNDCVNSVCAAGVATSTPDDTEAPDDSNDCTQDSCVAGTEMNVPASVGTPCMAGVCNASGQCEGCKKADDCGTTDACKHWSCDARICDVAYTPAGNPLPDGQQTDEDCQELQCDGSGSTQSIADNGDEPANDGLACTDDTCSAGVPVHPPLPANTGCGNGKICDGAGNCVECIVDSDCNAPEICDANHTCVCVPITCASAGITCGTLPDGCGTTLNCDDGVKNGTETDVDCGGGTAGTCKIKCSAGKTCSVTGDCASSHCADGVCCNSDCTTTCKACNLPATLGSCSNVPILTPDPPNCTGTMSCGDGANCKLANGQTCTGASQCASNNCSGTPKICQ